MSSRWMCALAVAVILGSVPSLACAQTEPTARDAEARALFEAGRMAFSEGHYEDSYERFSEAYRLSGRPELLYNMASAADRLRRDALALEHYRAFLAAVPETPERASVEHRITILESANAADREPMVVVMEGPAPIAPPSEDDAPHATPVWEEWWLWTIVAVVVVGAGVGIGVGVATSSPSTAPLMPGDVGPGGVVLTLTTPF